MGAKIRGRRHATSSAIEGVERLHGARHRVMPDRIETGTFLAAAARRGGDVRLTRHARRHPRSRARQAARMRRAHRGGRRLDRACARTARCARSNVRTAPYPAFPTDMQAQFMALNSVASGHGAHHRDDFREPLHARAGAEAPRRATSSSKATRRVVKGVPHLDGATVMATDLRASASLVLGGLVARGNDDDRARLSPRPRLRAHRGEALAARRAHRARALTGSVACAAGSGVARRCERRETRVALCRPAAARACAQSNAARALELEVLLVGLGWIVERHRAVRQRADELAHERIARSLHFLRRALRDDRRRRR